MWSRGRLSFAPALLCVLALALSAPAVTSESLFDDDEVAAWKDKQAQDDQPAGESLFDDDEVAAWKDKQADDGSEPAENEVTFKSQENPLTNDISFDERGNIAQGGSTEPDIAFYHVVELNGERIDEPTEGSAKLMELIEKGDDYEVKLAPPSFNQFQCTEKVQSMEQVLEEYSHEFQQEILDRVAATLASEGITNTKQLGEVDLQDFDDIKGLPALFKTRLRKVRAEARKQTEVAENKVEMDSAEVQDELNKFMAARGAVDGTATANATKEEVQVAVTEQPAVPEEEEDGTFKSLVWAVLNCPTCKGKETIECFRTCRYNVVLGEEGKKRSWSDCLDQCIENRWLRATFSAMLPRS